MTNIKVLPKIYEDENVIALDVCMINTGAMAAVSATVDNISSIGDVTINAVLSAGDVLTWNGAGFGVCAAAAGAGVSATVTDLTSVISILGAANASAGNPLVCQGSSCQTFNTSVAIMDNEIIFDGTANTTGTQYHIGVAYCACGNLFMTIGHVPPFANSARDNLVIGGDSAGIHITDGYQNVLIGNRAGSEITSGINNFALGYAALQTGQVTTRTVAIGVNAGAASSGTGSVYIGHLAGNADTHGAHNTFIGMGAGQTLVSGSDNTFIGYFAGNGAASGGLVNNTFIGANAGANGNSGIANVLVGANAGLANQGSYNVMDGFRAGQSNKSGSYNTFVGAYAGQLSISGGYNVMVGYQAGYCADGSGNVYIGNMAGYNFCGNNMLCIHNTQATAGLIVGSFSACYVTINGTLAVSGGSGLRVGSTASITEYSRLMPNYLQFNPTAAALSSTLYIGINSASTVHMTVGYRPTYPHENFLIGRNAGISLSACGRNNHFIGNNAGMGVQSGANNFVFGNAQLNSGAVGVVSVGIQAGNRAIAGTFIGYAAGIRDLAAGANPNVFIGDYAGAANNNGIENVYVGFYAGADGALNQYSAANYSVYLGARVAENMLSGDQNTFIGWECARYNKGSYNTLVGLRVARGLGSANYNIALGGYSMYTNVSGGKNVMLGYQTGYCSDGSGNVFIGYNAGYNYGSVSNKLVIHNSAGTAGLIVGDFAACQVGFNAEVYISGCGLQIGPSGGAYTKFQSDGSYRTYGSATKWDDLMIPGQSVRGGATAPSFEVFSCGIYTYMFATAAPQESVFFSLQMPHAWEECSTIFAHVHYAPVLSATTTRAIRFGLEYTWATIGEAFPAPTTLYMSGAIVSGNSSNCHLLATDVSGIVGTCKTLSSMLMCRLFRDNTVANNYTEKAAFLQFDIHYEKDSDGSSQEYVK